MKCNDCIYEKMCESRYEREHCLSFKDKANFVEVVRCKDCKHGQKNNYGFLRGRYICEYHQDYTPLFSPSHFCGNGERREENER